MSNPTPLIVRTTARDIEETLGGEHARLMGDVDRRAAPVLSLLDARVWPHAVACLAAAHQGWTASQR
jgi:hypothetical protein